MSILGCLAIGVGLDRVLGTSPLFTVLGGIAGGIGGLYSLYLRVVK
ncbi:MAG: AtpZ/AtpI family protein [Veillonella sp.]|nr:AtpZ/AtpI family protein [Veillonella sp.]